MRCPVGFPSGVAPLMAFDSPSRITPAIRSVARSGQRRSRLAFGPPPMELLAPSMLPAWGIDVPDAPSPHLPFRGHRGGQGLADAFGCILVAGFHARFAPPSPFMTTLTVCSPPHPVICFNHSHPWGLFPVSRYGVSNLEGSKSVVRMMGHRDRFPVDRLGRLGRGSERPPKRTPRVRFQPASPDHRSSH